MFSETLCSALRNHSVDFLILTRTLLMLMHTFYICIYIYIYIQGVPGGNVPDFGRVFLMSNYTDITQDTYVQS